MYLLYGFVILAYHVNEGLPAPSIYDHRQSGHLNIQVQLKDVQVLALLDSETLDDYTEYDYFYDYADFTVKPPSKPTTKPTTTSSIESSTIALPTNSQENVSISEQNSPNKSEEVTFTESSHLTVQLDSLTNIPIPSSPTTINVELNGSNGTLKTRINDKTYDLCADEDDSVTKNSENPTAESTFQKPENGLRKRCKSGYLPNGKGRCRSVNRRRLALMPIALKLVPQFFGDKNLRPKDSN